MSKSVLITGGAGFIGSHRADELLEQGYHVREHLPQRVLMTADTVGGVWTYAMELAGALSRQGVEVALATMGAPVSRAQKREAAGIPTLELFPSRYRLEWMDDPWADVQRAGEWLLGLEKDLHPDVVHLNGYAHGALPWSAPVMIVAHSCVCSWWRAVRHEEAPPTWNAYAEAVRAGLRGADMVVAPSRAMLNDLLDIYGPVSRSRVIPNGRHLPELVWQTKEEFIFSAGRVWDEAKNVRMLGAVASQLPWPVFVAGDDRDPEGRATPLDGVTLLGRLPANALLPWFSRAAIYALPARYEPFGLSVVEAALADCALVLADIPSLHENWDGAALFADPDDPGQWRQIIFELMSNWRTLIRLGVRARERARQLTPARMAEAYAEAYASLLAAPRRDHRRGVMACAS